TKYLVATSKCKIPDLEPFDPQVKKFYHPEKYTPCRKLELLTYVTKTDNIATLHIDTEIVPSYTKNNVICCYSNITRQENKNNPDDGLTISACIPFKDNVTLHEDFITVKCKNSKTKKKIYENTHAAITINSNVKRKLETLNNNTNPFSVLFVGIDSISRLNFIRSLPTTYQFLEDNEWISLKGYNKIGDNTFPNVMAILSGFNESYAYATCDPKKLNKLDYCPLIWYDFRKFNYVTGYAEDEAWINTFNYRKKGFTHPPTDYYFRPYIMGSERLKMVRKDEMNYCTGPETAGERILNIAKDFAITFKDYSSFAFFWMNTFSHNELNSPSGMDKKVKGFLEDIANSGVLENSIVIFLSDHGMRFGEIRYTPIGWLEERLPFIYISVPERFQKQFPNEYRNLENNRHQLTNPYDLYMTLQHILILSGFNYTMKPSTACPGCKSLFMNTKSDRSCEDAAIEQHWCTCAGYNPISQNNQTVKDASNYIVGQIHAIIHAKRSDSKCAKYYVNRIIAASISETFTYKNDIYLLLVIETKPKAVFEATISYTNDASEDTFQLKGGISRLDRYSSHSRCTDDAYLKKYCYCR
ncbi:uncharacterized protein BDFB_010973, partial [Asbolus verrucosus]